MSASYPSVRSFGLVPNLIIVVLAIILIPKSSSYIADQVFPLLAEFDPNRSFVWLFIHHTVQLFLTLVLMLVMARENGLTDWGFNLNRWRTSLAFIFGLILIFGTAELVRIQGGGSSAYNAPLEQRDMVGVQAFQYIMSGLGEEPLFRAFIMIFLAGTIPQIFKLGELELPVTVLISTALFMFAHIQIDYSSLTILHIDFGQQMKALQFGIVYGVAFHYTRSLLAPIVMHGLSNGLPMSIELYLV